MKRRDLERHLRDEWSGRCGDAGPREQRQQLARERRRRTVDDAGGRRVGVVGLAVHSVGLRLDASVLRVDLLDPLISAPVRQRGAQAFVALRHLLHLFRGLLGQHEWVEQ